ncbi:glucan endo-1,3-beta-glucosidase 13-like [Tasmannia lanceolata]|uniref:glucan endo-1,3-beta-glucosidase 13-like n=1 Tax=Tasmannia lanceolata TaxID=3420 RepID=UPI004062C0F4
MAHFTLTPYFLFFLLFFFFASAESGSIGVNYGRIADNLPPATKVVQLLKTQNIDRVKLYDTDPTILRTFAGTQIKLTVGFPNEQLSSIAKHPSQALTWVQNNILPFHPSTQIETIAVGNEVFVDPHNTTSFLVPAMINIQAALVKYKLDSVIKISTPIALSCLQSSYPSSAGAFKSELIEPVIKPMLEFLRRTGSFLMVNAYPFFAYEGNADVISLDYALFRPNAGVVDSGNNLRYLNLFDAQIDAVFSAMSVLQYPDINITVSETGWPSEGDDKETGSTTTNAATYNGNLIRHILSGTGTPLRPKSAINTYLFALFNENQKPGPSSERNYGLFYPNEEKVYDIAFTPEGLKRLPAPEEREAPVARGGSVRASSSGVSWCVANGKMSEGKLQKALDYACGEGGADCRQIQPGATCYDPNTLVAHASFAFNSYYQKKGRGIGTCDFQGAAFVVSHPPKFGKCAFPTGD